MITHIKNSMSDRAAVNNATVKKLEEVCGTNILQLNCHLHLLDTMASSCRAALRREEEKSRLFGNDCVARGEDCPAAQQA
jgi:hypothetical protein